MLTSFAMLATWLNRMLFPADGIWRSQIKSWALSSNLWRSDNRWMRLARPHSWIIKHVPHSWSTLCLSKSLGYLRNHARRASDRGRASSMSRIFRLHQDYSEYEGRVDQYVILHFHTTNGSLTILNQNERRRDLHICSWILWSKFRQEKIRTLFTYGTQSSFS